MDRLLLEFQVLLQGVDRELLHRDLLLGRQAGSDPGGPPVHHPSGLHPIGTEGHVRERGVHRH